jgi:aspartyl-tRNA(Asn)/glutamyl-tRNA(Gln) amidotransferase subunit C
MSIDRADIEKLGELARIAITEENIEATTRSINEVLALVDQLQSANTDGVEPLANPLDATQRLRHDEISEINRRDDFQPLAPEAENGLYLVPKVID